MLRRFSLRLPAVSLSWTSGLKALRFVGGGGLPRRDSAGVPEVELNAGVPSRSTPSLAAVINALPNVVGSNRPGRLDVLRLAVAWESEPIPVPRCAVALLLLLTVAVAFIGDSIGEDSCRFSFRGLERWAWKSSIR